MLLAAACIFAVAALPREVKHIMMDYGAREERPQTRQKGEAPQEYRLVRQFAAYTAVPHSWFSSYYYTSVAGLAFWAYQFLRHGRLMQLLASRQASAGLPSMAMEQVYVTWGLMALQGTRRLLESWALVKPSKSKMGVLHWLLGIAFYAGMSLSVWIEGSRTLPSSCIHEEKLLLTTTRGDPGKATRPFERNNSSSRQDYGSGSNVPVG